MRYSAAALLFSALFAAPRLVIADSPRSAPRASVAAVMPNAGQALLFDRIQGEYVVVRAGDFVQGYRVSEVEIDQVVLHHPDAPARHYVLPVVSELRPMGERTVRCGPGAAAGTPTAEPAPQGSFDLIDPYGQDSPPDSDSYPTNDHVTTVLAPPDQRASTQPVEAPTEQPSSTAAATDASHATSADSAPAPLPADAPRALDVPTTVVQPPAAPPPIEESRTIRRTEFDRALADFHALSKEVQIAIRGGEVHITSIADGTYFHRLGLRKGDTLVSVAGQRVSSLDAAASVYAKLMTTVRFAVVVRRAGGQVTLRYRFAD